MHVPKLVRLLTLVFLAAVNSHGAEPQAATHTLPDDPKAAWAEVEKVHMALRPPSDWRNKAPTKEEIEKFQKQIWLVAISFAGKAQEFAERFPKNENAGDARVTRVYALAHALAAGDDAAEKDIEKYVAATLADKTISEQTRVTVFLMAGNAAVLKQAGMRYFTEGQMKFREEMERAGKIQLREAAKKFPNSTIVYGFMLALAQRAPREEQKEMATEILNAQGASEAVKNLAKHLLAGTKPYEIGKPLDIKFAALDGREVDLATLKGKVVLIDFWSTTCGPCISGMPELKSVYEKLHPRGFEIIGISLDDKESALRQFIKEKNLPWPQHFDGKGWQNKFAARYGIFSIPTMWLVDRSGNLLLENARGNLQQQVERLLDEKK